MAFNSTNEQTENEYIKQLNRGWGRALDAPSNQSLLSIRKYEIDQHLRN